MKFAVTFKSPDGVSAAAYDAACDDGLSSDEVDDLSYEETEERDEAIEQLVDEACEHVKKWVRFGEFVTIEFDTDAGTATVIPVK